MIDTVQLERCSNRKENKAGREEGNERKKKPRLERTKQKAFVDGEGKKG